MIRRGGKEREIGLPYFCNGKRPIGSAREQLKINSGDLSPEQGKSETAVRERSTFSQGVSTKHN